MMTSDKIGAQHRARKAVLGRQRQRRGPLELVLQSTRSQSIRHAAVMAGDAEGEEAAKRSERRPDGWPHNEAVMRSISGCLALSTIMPNGVLSGDRWKFAAGNLRCGEGYVVMRRDQWT